jgi:hypothetical protein
MMSVDIVAAGEDPAKSSVARRSATPIRRDGRPNIPDSMDSSSCRPSLKQEHRPIAYDRVSRCALLVDNKRRRGTLVDIHADLDLRRSALGRGLPRSEHTSEVLDVERQGARQLVRRDRLDRCGLASLDA